MVIMVNYIPRFNFVYKLLLFIDLKITETRFATIQSSFFTLNKHSVRSLSAARASDHFKLCAYLLSSYEYLV